MEGQLEQDLVKLWSFFKWLDNARWNWDKEKRTWIKQMLNYVNDVLDKPIKDFEPKHLVLTHWLTYIFNYQVQAEDAWRKCFPIMFCIVKDFQEGYPIDAIMSESKYLMKKDKRVYFRVRSVTFRHRFQDKDKLIEKVERTLTILENFNRDLIEFMVGVSNYGDENDWVRRVACALYLLTYDSKKDVNKAIEILTDKKKFENYYSSKKINLWHKRLWAALRDYLKSSIHEYIKKSLENYEYDSRTLNRWRDPQKYLNQLEVPGDIWNEKFYNNVMYPLIKELGLILSKDPPRGIRTLYERYRDIFEKHGFYPEQFDVTFDFARIFCDRNLCYICPLHSDENIKRLCIGDTKSEKYCPILAVVGYLQPCNPNDCPIYRRETLGLCVRSI